MSPQENSCLVFVETLGETRVVPFAAIKTIPSVSWVVPNYQNRHRSDKKRKRNWHSNELSYKSYSKYSKNDEDVYHGIHYFTKTLHIPQQYCEYITQPHYGTNRFAKNDENGGGNNQSSNKNAPTKKSNAGDKLAKVDNAKNASAKRAGTTAETKSGKADAQNVEFEPHVHYGNPTNMGYVDPTNTITFQHMERGDMEGSIMGPPNYGK